MIQIIYNKWLLIIKLLSWISIFEVIKNIFKKTCIGETTVPVKVNTNYNKNK